MLSFVCNQDDPQHYDAHVPPSSGQSTKESLRVRRHFSGSVGFEQVAVLVCLSRSGNFVAISSCPPFLAFLSVLHSQHLPAASSQYAHQRASPGSRTLTVGQKQALDYIYRFLSTFSGVSSAPKKCAWRTPS